METDRRSWLSASTPWERTLAHAQSVVFLSPFFSIRIQVRRGGYLNLSLSIAECSNCHTKNWTAVLFNAGWASLCRYSDGRYAKFSNKLRLCFAVLIGKRTRGTCEVDFHVIFHRLRLVSPVLLLPIRKLGSSEGIFVLVNRCTRTVPLSARTSQTHRSYLQRLVRFMCWCEPSFNAVACDPFLVSISSRVFVIFELRTSKFQLFDAGFSLRSVHQCLRVGLSHFANVWPKSRST